MSAIASSDESLQPGYVLGAYRIVSRLGQGGFGITYKARDQFDSFVAIKEYLPRAYAERRDGVVRARSGNDGQVFKWGLDRFIDEGRALRKFKHANIVSVYNYLELNGTAYLVMEFEEGANLESWISANIVPPSEALLVHRILLPLLDGLQTIHAEGLLHRDIKPENILLRRDNSPVLIDFGASRSQVHGLDGTDRVTTLVSAGYSPIEQYGSGDGQGPWSDLYALAGTMYRLAVGRAPADAIDRWRGTDRGKAHQPARIAAAGRYSPELLAAIDKGLSVDASDRPQSAQAFKVLLGGAPAPMQDPVPVNRARSTSNDDWSRTTIVSAPGPVQSTRTSKWRRTIVAAALGLTAASAIALYVWFSSFVRFDVTPVNAELFIDGNRLTDAKTRLTPGPHQLAVVAKDSYGQLLTIDAPFASPYAVSLKPLDLPTMIEFRRFTELDHDERMGELPQANVAFPPYATLLALRADHSMGRQALFDEQMRKLRVLAESGDPASRLILFVAFSNRLLDDPSNRVVDWVKQASNDGYALATYYYALYFRSMHEVDGTFDAAALREYRELMALAAKQGLGFAHAAVREANDALRTPNP